MQVGAVIGKGGAEIKSIRDESHAYVKVEPAASPEATERVVTLTGALPHVVSMHPVHGYARVHPSCAWHGHGMCG